jgi:dimethylamine/trimethylamine dehydrogenase
VSIIAERASPAVGRPPEHDLLFDQIRVGPVVAPNRLWQVPHCTGFGARYPRSQAAFRAAKARGGWGAVFTEYTSIDPSSSDAPWVNGTIWDDGDVARWQLMTAAVHEHGALAGIQLWYGGGAAGMNLDTREPARGISPVIGDQAPIACIDMTEAEIAELEGWYAAAAARAVQAGFDLVEIGAAEVDNIMLMVLMARYNQRTGRYGGPLENRARLLTETLEQVRAAIGDRAAVGVRLCVDTLDGSDQGIRAGVEGCQIIGLADHLVDYWSVQAGGWGSDTYGNDPEPSSAGAGTNFQACWIRAVRPATAKPLIGVGRHTDPHVMAQVITEGQQDIIGAARPSIADPYLPAKIRDGRAAAICECIGCNMCSGRFVGNITIACAQNPAAGYEFSLGWDAEDFPPAANADVPVLIIGAGPAGLDCAYTLARRGFTDVHMIDAAPEPGGAMRWIRRLPGLAEWDRLTAWRIAELRGQPVKIQVKRRLTTAEVLDYGAPIVICATGAAWAADGLNWHTRRPIPGAGLPHVLTPEQAMTAELPRGRRILVYDCDGHHTGPGIAQLLASRGLDVRVATPFAAVAPYLEASFEAAAVRRRLAARRVTVACGTTLDSIEPGTARLSRAGGERTIDAATVVLVTQRLPRAGLYRELEADPARLGDAGITGLYRIGDCVIPGHPGDAVFSGRRLAMAIDTDDPARPPAIRRELPVA